MEFRDREKQMPEERFSRYMEILGEALDHEDRVEPLRAYCTGLLLPGERKSVEPMAARLAPSTVSSKHQSMHHFVAEAPWSDTRLLSAVRTWVMPALEHVGGVATWIIDDSGFPKKGSHSVGVARQYCGQLGKQENCQVAVSLSVANEHASLPIAFRLYLPREWATDLERRRKAGVPDEITFQEKPQIALEQIEAALRAGVPVGVVTADAAYGNDTAFRDRLTELKLLYAVGIQKTTSLWPEGTGPLPPAEYKGTGRKPKLLRRDEEHTPVSAYDLALSQPRSAYRKVTWREGSKGQMSSRFCALRVRAAHRDNWRSEVRDQEWLVVEWPEGASEPTKYYLATLPRRTSVKKLVHTVKLRWRIEHDYEELKQEVGLGHYEGRGWRGFHHHAALSIAAYGFLVAERGLFPPSADRAAPGFDLPEVPGSSRPRGAADSTRAAQPDLDRLDAGDHHGRAGTTAPTMPDLSARRSTSRSSETTTTDSSGSVKVN